MAISELSDLIRVFSQEYGPQLGDGLTAAAFRIGDRVKKVYSHDIPKAEIFKEAYSMARVEAAGIRAPKVFGVTMEHGYWVLEMTCIEGRPLLESIGAALQAGDDETAYRYVARMAREQASINLSRGEGLPRCKDYAAEIIERNASLRPVQKERLLKLLAELPDGSYICHGDLHPNNYLLDGSNTLTAIDWPEVGLCVPAYDAARTYLNMCHPAMIRNGLRKLSDVFLDAYCEASGVTKEEIFAWLPIQAGMLVGYKKEDFSAVCAQYLP